MRGRGTLAYLAVALLTQVRALGDLADRTQPDGDVPQTDWFLAWTPHALGSGRNPLYTDAVNLPDGVNLTWNTWLPLPGVLAWPVTATLGPAAAHTLLLVVAFAGSMLAMRWCASAFTARPVTAWLAGLAYGCSPYLVAQAHGHLNLALAITPPLIARVLYELFTGRRSWQRAGLLLALFAVVQFLITEEVLVSAAVTAAAATGVLALRHRRRLSVGRVREVAEGLALGALLPLVVLGVPVAYQLLGPRTLTGPATVPTSFSADVLGLLLPSESQLLHLGGTAGFSGNPTENGSLVGPALLGLLLWSAWRYRGVVLDWTLVAGVAWVLSLGGFVRVAGHPTAVKLPFLAVWKVPLLGSLVPARFSLFAFLAVVLAVVAASEHWALPRAAAGRVGAGLLAAAVVLPLAPAWPYAYTDVTVPPFFRDGGVRELPRDSVLATWPVARHRYGSPTSSPVHWQAFAQFRYRTLAGYVITPDAAGRGTYDGGVTAWERTATAVAAGRPAPDEARVRAEWAELGVQAVAVDPTATGAPRVAQLLVRLTGRQPQATDGVQLWRLS